MIRRTVFALAAVALAGGAGQYSVSGTVDANGVVTGTMERRTVGTGSYAFTGTISR